MNMDTDMNFHTNGNSDLKAYKPKSVRDASSMGDLTSFS